MVPQSDLVLTFAHVPRQMPQSIDSVVASSETDSRLGREFEPAGELRQSRHDGRRVERVTECGSDDMSEEDGVHTCMMVQCLSLPVQSGLRKSLRGNSLALV